MTQIANPLLRDMDVSWNTYAGRYQELLEQEVSPRDIEAFLLEWGNLETEVDHVYSVRSLNAHLNTTDEVAQKRYEDFVREVQTHREEVTVALREKLLGLDHTFLPEDARRMVQRFAAEVRIHADENLPLIPQMSELEQEYTRINGSLRVQYQGESHTIPQLQPFLQSPDRRVREGAWRALQEARLEVAPRLDDLFLRMLKLRRELARNAGYPDFRAYMWERYHRFDYTPSDCLRFHESVEAEVVPLVAERLEQHQKALGLEVLKPWDAYWYTAVEPAHLPPLKPFHSISELEEKVERVFFQLSPHLGKMFRTFREAGAMDLGARENKLTQAYCTTLPLSKLPFLFQNVVGTSNDVAVTLHEAGHAFHAHVSMDTQRLPWNHFSSIEFAEVPSTAMEFMALDHLSVFYGPEEMQRVKASALWGAVHGLPWMCVLDAFQHWLYVDAPEDVTIEMLDLKARELHQRFMPQPSWEGLEHIRSKVWHFFHVFYMPFYYIEYAFSTLGALQVWRNYQQDPEKTIGQYLESLAAGNSLSVPELYQKAGVHFQFDRETVRDLMQFVRRQS